MMATVSLQMIVKDEVNEVYTLVSQAYNYFDKINLTVSDEKAAKKLAKSFKEDKKTNVKVEHRPWNDNFADARNDNLKMCDTDYFFWVDSDDTFDFFKIEALVELAENDSLDAIYLPYHYAHDENGNCVALHYRERLVKSGTGKWEGAIHETYVQKDKNITVLERGVPVIHKATDEDAMKSIDRNHKILHKYANLENPDPRYVYYLGLSYFTRQEYAQCIKTLQKYIPLSGWDEEIYRAYCKISESYGYLHNNDAAIAYALKALQMLPQYPDAYYLLGQFEFEVGRYEEAKEWLKMIFNKKNVQTLSVVDPTSKSRALVIAAMCEYELHNFAPAYELLKKAIEMNPSLENARELLSMYQYEASKEAKIEAVGEIIKMVEDKKLFFESLPTDLKNDIRLKWLQTMVTEPKVWPDKSIVFFCGKGFEEWGPHTLDKGMGGSEEAVIYLTRELIKLGYSVTVYSEVKDAVYDLVELQDGTSKAVTYLPWQQIDKRDTFDTIVIWRAPEFSDHLNAKVKIVDLHDVIDASRVTEGDQIYFVKSEYHKSLFPKDRDYAVIGNGIVTSQFDGNNEKKPNSIGYFSAYYRGLECLLDMWADIRKEVPDATLDVFYGWESYVAFEGEDDFYHRMEKKFAELKDKGVTVHGRVSHEQLAKEMQKIQVWAYPTQFPEIHCITALKAQQAECYPVATRVAALNETVQSGSMIDTEIIYIDGYQQKKFVKEVVSALKEKKIGTPVPDVDWSDVAKKWSEVIDERRS